MFFCVLFFSVFQFLSMDSLRKAVKCLCIMSLHLFKVSPWKVCLLIDIPWDTLV